MVSAEDAEESVGRLPGKGQSPRIEVARRLHWPKSAPTARSLPATDAKECPPEATAEHRSTRFPPWQRMPRLRPLSRRPMPDAACHPRHAMAGGRPPAGRRSASRLAAAGSQLQPLPQSCEQTAKLAAAGTAKRATFGNGLAGHGSSRSATATSHTPRSPVKSSCSSPTAAMHACGSAFSHMRRGDRCRVTVGNHFFLGERLLERMRRFEHHFNFRTVGHRLKIGPHVGK